MFSFSSISIASILFLNTLSASAFQSHYDTLLPRELNVLLARDWDLVESLLAPRYYEHGSIHTGDLTPEQQRSKTEELQQEMQHKFDQTKGPKDKYYPMFTSFHKPGTDGELHYGTSTGSSDKKHDYEPQLQWMMKNADNKNRANEKMNADPNLTKSAAKKQVKHENKETFRTKKNEATSSGKTKAEGKKAASQAALESAQGCHKSRGGCGEHSAMNHFAAANPGVPLHGGNSYSVGALNAQQRKGEPASGQAGCEARTGSGKLGCVDHLAAAGVHDLFHDIKIKRNLAYRLHAREW